MDCDPGGSSHSRNIEASYGFICHAGSFQHEDAHINPHRIDYLNGGIWYDRDF